MKCDLAVCCILYIPIHVKRTEGMKSICHSWDSYKPFLLGSFLVRVRVDVYLSKFLRSIAAC